MYDGWVPVDAPEPRVVEVDGSTADAAWLPLSGVLDGTIPVATLVTEALEGHRPHRRQRAAAYALVLRGDEVLLTRISARGFHSGSWTLPGGGIDHGESPRDAVRREVLEECGIACVVGDVLEVDDIRISGTAPSGRDEDFHGLHLVFAATVDPDAEPRVVEVGGTTDAVAWVGLAQITDGSVPVLEVVTRALAAHARRAGRSPQDA